MITKLFMVGVAFALMVSADDSEAGLRDAMKAIGPANGGLGKKLAAKDASASEDAKKLAGLFSNTRGYWEAKKIDDGVQFTASAIGVYEKVGSLLSEGKWDEAADEQKKVGASCQGCHTAHREKLPEGGYKIK